MAGRMAGSGRLPPILSPACHQRPRRRHTSRGETLAKRPSVCCPGRPRRPEPGAQNFCSAPSRTQAAVTRRSARTAVIRALSADQAQSLKVIGFQIVLLRDRRVCARTEPMDWSGRMQHILRLWARSAPCNGHLTQAPRASRSHHRLAPEAARFPAPTARDRRPLVCHSVLGSVCAPGLLVPAQLEEVHRDGKCTGKVEVPAVTRVPGSVTARAVILRSDTKRGELHPLREVPRLHRPVAAAGDRAAAVRADRHRGLTSDTGLLTVPSCDGRVLTERHRSPLDDCSIASLVPPGRGEGPRRRPQLTHSRSRAPGQTW